MFRTLASATTLGPNELLGTIDPPESGSRERYGLAHFFHDADRDVTNRRRLDDSRNMLSDEDLMEGYKAGDRAAFAEIFRRYAPLLLRVMQHQLGRREDANDLVQQTFLQLHRSKQDFRRGSLLRPWLLTIAMNLRHRHFRRLGRHPEMPLELDLLEELHTGSRVPDAADAGCDVKALLAGLPAEQREVIILHWIEGLPFNEVAVQVGVSLSAVKVRAHRGYVAIRKLFAQESGVMGARVPPKGRSVGTPQRQ
jgi:RNA polymerase sigma factor (sigma-70 family)